jgi:hypothetical protein
MMVPAILISRKSDDNWRSIALPKAIGPIDRIVVSGNFAAALGPYVVFVSTNSGESWSALSYGAVDNEEEDVYPVSAAIFGERIWVSFKNGSLFGGSVRKQELLSISKSSSPLGPLTFVSPCAGLALRADDVVKSEDGGVTWISVTHSKNVRALSGTTLGAFGIARDQLFRIEISHVYYTDDCSK